MKKWIARGCRRGIWVGGGVGEIIIAFLSAKFEGYPLKFQGYPPLIPRESSAWVTFSSNIGRFPIGSRVYV